MLCPRPYLCSSHPSQYFGRDFEHQLAAPGGVIARVTERILALTAAIWHNDHTGQRVLRSLTAYDH